MDPFIDCWSLWRAPTRFISPWLDGCYKSCCGRWLFKGSALLVGLLVCVHATVLLLGSPRGFGLGHISFLCTKVLRDSLAARYDCQTMPHVSDGTLVFIECAVHEDDLDAVSGVGPFSDQSLHTLALRAEVEMFQCVECDPTRYGIRYSPGYQYSKEWHQAPVKSAHFHEPSDAQRACREVLENPPWPHDLPVGHVRYASGVRLGRFASKVLSVPTSMQPDIPVTAWRAPAMWSANLDAVLDDTMPEQEVERLANSYQSCRDSPFMDQIRRRRVRFYDRRRYTTNARVQVDDLYAAGWTSYNSGNLRLYCTQDSLTYKAPPCDASTAGTYVYYDYPYVYHECNSTRPTRGNVYSRYVMMFYCSAGATTTTTTTTPPPQDTFYSRAHVVSNQTGSGMLRVRFFTTDFADPTSPDDPNPGLKVVRIGQVKNGSIEKWTAPWPCSERYSQDKMFYVTHNAQEQTEYNPMNRRRRGRMDYDDDDRYFHHYDDGSSEHLDKPHLEGLTCLEEYDPEKKGTAETLFMDCEYTSPPGAPYWRPWLEPAAYLAILFYYYLGCILMSLNLPLFGAGSEQARPQCHFGRAACLGVPLSISVFSLVLGVLHLLIVGASVIGVGGTFLAVACGVVACNILWRQSKVVMQSLHEDARVLNEPLVTEEMSRLD